ncbi:MAG: hypothetical protein A2136_10000 [Chloroflexi bacterium RBG_16_54_11]|nr:MAG: hypothetical protein A2136_10000 [Chloroflexi bacterium RBG_16_54_11]
MDFLSSSLYIWVVLPLLVFTARVTDVSLGTLRIIFISKGRRNLAPVLGFVEVFIWITIVSQIVSSAHNILAYIAYAAGFAAGNYVGIYIEGRLAIGTQVVLAIVQEHATRLTTRLHSAGYGVTCVDGEGANGPVKLVYTIVPRRSLEAVLNIIHETHPRAFLSIQDVRSTQEGVFPIPTVTQFGSFFPRKSK